MTTVTNSNDEIITKLYIELDILKINENKIKIYALDVQTIGLSNNPSKNWTDNCLWVQEADIIQEDTEFTIVLPPQVVRFYKPRKIEIAGNIEQDNILLIVHQ